MSEKNFSIEGIPMYSDFSTTALSGPGLSGSASATVSPTLSTLYYLLIPFVGERTWTTIKAHVTTVGSGSNVLRAGMYSVDPLTGKPKDLIIDAGTVGMTVGTGEKTISFSQKYSGPFYLAYASQVGTTAVMRACSAAAVVTQSFYGRTITVSSTTSYTSISETSVTGALPSTSGSLSMSTATPPGIVIY